MALFDEEENRLKHLDLPSDLAGSNESSSMEDRPRRKSYNEQVLEIVFEMVDEELKSNQKVLTSVCKHISDQISEACQAVKSIADSVTTI